MSVTIFIFRELARNYFLYPDTGKMKYEKRKATKKITHSVSFTSTVTSMPVKESLVLYACCVFVLDSFPYNRTLCLPL